ncbi:MAG TPA: glycerol kinase GlpK, partial [Beijerinckiaceae bacterium]|nr:glycerol kinase GlpK [Beijerinckiaceae bacterium]
TSTRAVLFQPDLKAVAASARELTQLYPAAGLVEHDPEEIWASVLETARATLARAGIVAADVASIGITNQRETVVVWDRTTGRPIHNAIVWQDRRGADLCGKLDDSGHAPLFERRTGLVLDPYFSATKIVWLLDHVAGARERARRGELAFGTIDCFLLWRLTGGRVHATDITNASRTLMFDIHRGQWDEELLAILAIPASLLPSVRDCSGAFGTTEPDFLGAPVAIGGGAGDQQAAAIGQACFEPGMMKATYGTGGFLLVNTGPTPVASRHRLLTTIAYQINGCRSYALEGSIFAAGAALNWLRDEIGIIASADQADALAAAADPAQSVILVPAFAGLGAPYWDAHCRAAFHGLSFATTRRELVRAALESVAFQTRDLLSAIDKDWPQATGLRVLRVDGGMAASDWLAQNLADITGAPVERPPELETTAMGAAYLAGLAAGLVPPPAEFAARWTCARRFEPMMTLDERDSKYAAWQDAVARTLSRT